MEKCKDCIYYKNECTFDKFGEFVACAQFKAKSNEKKDNRENLIEKGKVTYKIGQILTSEYDVEVKRGISGEKVIIPKGNKIIIGADNLAHHMRNRMLQPLGDSIEVKGYDAEGIAEFIFSWISRFYPIHEMLEDYEVSEKEFISEIECALDEIGF